MEIILLKDHISLGEAGDVVNVKPGFARNLLIPSGVALRATNKNLSIIEERKKNNTLKEEKEKAIFENIAKKLSKLEITIEVQVGDEDKMFGSILAKDIHKSILEKGISINQDSIILEKPIKSLGIYNIKVKVSQNIESSVKIYVIKS